MEIGLSASGELLPVDLIHRGVLRSDLTPVPRTLELTVDLLDDMEQRLAVGASVWAGSEWLEYRVAKTEPHVPLGQVQGERQRQGMSVTAILADCAGLAYPCERAVVQYGKTFSAAYRAAGGRLPFAADLPLPAFVCFVGQFATRSLAQVLQEAGAALVLRDGQASVMRLRDLLKEPPQESIEQVASTARVDSDLLELHAVPTFYSLDDAGAVMMGDRARGRSMQFMPRASQTNLNSASHVPVQRQVLPCAYAPHVRAGDVIEVMGQPLFVITGAHAWARQEGVVSARSQLWLGGINE